MIDYIRRLIDNKKVLILGYGKEGRSTLPVLLDARTAASVAVADANPVSDELPAGIEMLTGEKYPKRLDDFDIVFKSPGIVLEKSISEYSCNIVSQMQVFFECFRDRIIGVTGTKGKSTTTTLLYHVLKTAGVDVLLGGNIGIPVFEIAGMMKTGTTAVLELSCHQLEYMSAAAHRAVYLNLYEEHLDHYKTMEKYTAAKENIYKNQLEGDILYCLDTLAPNGGCRAETVTFSMGDAPKASEGVRGCGEADYTLNGSSIYYRDASKGLCSYAIPTDSIRLIGEHNYFDIAFVYAVCRDYGISDAIFSEALKSYEPLPHRLQFIGVQSGIKWYDDSISTIDETTIQALNTLNDADTVIIGGMDRQISYAALEEYLSGSGVSNIILMEESGRRIYDEIVKMGEAFSMPWRLQWAEHLEDAVRLARKLTRPGKSCVMSPAAASYGIFKNFEDRGEAFRRLVYDEGI